tara:strand:+ start:495 stop:1091 length:597 start_codon:yes stop_codon:yes gene_type:complete
MKFTFAGDVNTGKSSILFNYENNVFNESIGPSIGIDFFTKMINVNNKNVKLFIWDTVGQERYRAITKSYFRGVCGIFLVYSVDKRNTFYNLEKWLKNIKTDTNVPVIFLIANKIDLHDNNFTCVTTEEGKEFAENHGLYYFETSAKSGYNIEKIFTKMAETVLEKVNNKEIELKHSNGVKLNEDGHNQVVKTKSYFCC